MVLTPEEVASLIENTVADCIPDSHKDVSRRIALAVATQLCEDTELNINIRGRLTPLSPEENGKLSKVLTSLSTNDYYNMRNSILEQLVQKKRKDSNDNF